VFIYDPSVGAKKASLVRYGLADEALRLARIVMRLAAD
jgi:predicted RNA polymerase sigma factor